MLIQRKYQSTVNSMPIPNTIYIRVPTSNPIDENQEPKATFVETSKRSKNWTNGRSRSRDVNRFPYRR